MALLLLGRGGMVAELLRRRETGETKEDMRSLREVTTASPRGMITDEGRPLAVVFQLMLSGPIRRLS